ncbi:proenkephalin b [Callorhinchus milii]|uniref:Proenkephalin n=1 Tax=Callorhinchus milii TaxID=7868 RepID=V9KY48_CALMI|nr:proenkephalin b [Callorhinchus milii]XP_007889204.1 proenkephalin b [Callorhinchus milii]|eukprot:gi/632947745/ref/XP_007889203.1/ PREDICTED: proenkephalin-A [Callorhinchus milii]
MALLWKCHWLMAVLGTASLFLGIWADCDKECAYCAYRLSTQSVEFNPLSCTLECDGKLPSEKAWEMCRQVVQINMAQDKGQGSQENDGENEEQHILLAKKYGGFMKRYGGFMKKADNVDIYKTDADDENNGREILTKRYGGFMKKDQENASPIDSADVLRELLNLGDLSEHNRYLERSDSDRAGEILKRYGGFMRGFKRSPETEAPAELQKRYGGFMRRVGKPDWRLDYQKRYGGFMKRWNDALVPSDEDGEIYSKEVPELEKRYGGFMRV